MSTNNPMLLNPSSLLTILRVKRIHGRAILSLSNGDTVSMPRALLRERPYRSGMLFDSEAFQILLQERSYPFALEKAVSLLAGRARTEREISDALKRNAYPEMIIARVMQRLTEAGYINDTDFAHQWASSRVSKGIGARRIQMELRKKGVLQQDIDAASSSLDSDAMMDAAVIIAKKAARGKDVFSVSDRQKIIASLVRRGYDFSTARQAVQKLVDTSE